jgi:hypothetical protein
MAALLQEATFVPSEAGADKNVQNLATTCIWIYVACSINTDSKTIYKLCLSKFALCVCARARVCVCVCVCVEVFTKTRILSDFIALVKMSISLYTMLISSSQIIFLTNAKWKLKSLYKPCRSISLKRTWISKLGQIIVFCEIFFRVKSQWL